MEDEVSTVIPKATETTSGIFEHIFSLSSNDKSYLINLLQYTIVATICATIIFNFSQRMFSESNTEATNLEIIFEVVAEVATIFTFIYFMHRFITYLPTFTKREIETDINLIPVVLIGLFNLIANHGRISQKIKILVDRLMIYLGYNSAPQKPKDKKQDNHKVIGPPPEPIATQELKQPADLPNHNQLKETPAMKRQDNDFNNMYQGINEQQTSEPMAANDFFGGGFTSF